MDFHGHIDLNNNEMQKMVLQDEADFPLTPTVGRILFKGKRVWICVEVVAGVPAWVPLTPANNTHVHDQSTASTSWTVTHNLNSVSPLVQVYDLDMNMLVPDEVFPIDNDSLTITFGVAQTGRAVVMFGDPTIYPTG